MSRSGGHYRLSGDLDFDLLLFDLFTFTGVYLQCRLYCTSCSHLLLYLILSGSVWLCSAILAKYTRIVLPRKVSWNYTSCCFACILVFFNPKVGQTGCEKKLSWNGSFQGPETNDDPQNNHREGEDLPSLAYINPALCLRKCIIPCRGYRRTWMEVRCPSGKY